MKGLLVRLAIAIAALLWAWDMVFPWQKAMRSEENSYTLIQQQKKLTVGMINHPLSYFIGADGESGVEYELARSFADYLGVNLEIKPFDNTKQLFDALKKNEIDVAAAGLLYEAEQAENFQIGASYYSASWQVVYKKGTNRPYKIDDLKSTLIVPTGSAVIPILQRLKVSHPDLNWQTTDQFTQEELLIQVADGQIPYTVAISVDVSAAQHIKPNVAVGFDLTDEMPVMWYLPNSSYSELQASLLDFMHNAQESGLISRLEEKYFSHLSKFNYVDSQSFIKAIETVLPKYQPLFEKYSGDFDWQTLAAIAYQESHWDPNATSPTGVRGIMMLTKDTAEYMKVTDRTDPEQSIRGGSEYLHWLMAQLPQTIEKDDRIWFVLAGYNMGHGHLWDVRRLTKQLGGDPDNWLDVKKNLPLLAEKRYYSTLKYGYARGFEAFSYVENIRRYLNALQNHLRIKEQANSENGQAVEKAEEVAKSAERTTEENTTQSSAVEQQTEPTAQAEQTEQQAETVEKAEGSDETESNSPADDKATDSGTEKTEVAEKASEPMAEKMDAEPAENNLKEDNNQKENNNEKSENSPESEKENITH